MRLVRWALPVVLFWGAMAVAAQQQSALPMMERLHPQDTVFQQHIELIAAYHRAVAQRTAIPPLVVARLRVTAGESLFAIASRLMLPYGTIASFNGLSSPELRTGDLWIPSVPGLFVPEEPQTELHLTLHQRLHNVPHLPINFDGQTYGRFYVGLDFGPEERAQFLRIQFRHPLNSGRLSSQFGYRASPISGVRHFHSGIDIAAAYGTPVIAAAAGTVSAIVRDPVLGLTIHIDHRDGYQTRYAHLQRAEVRLHQPVNGGMIIGQVGSTGMSTGPHLHFEIWHRGRPRDPLPLLRTGP